MSTYCGYYTKNDKANDEKITDMIEVTKQNDSDICDKYITCNLKFASINQNISSYKYKNNIYTICYTGNIFNKKELVRILKEHNIILDDKSDEKIILSLFALFNVDMLLMLNGTYSFVIFDKQNNKLLLVRDRLGVKPLYYTTTFCTTPSFIFSTSIKSILKHSDVKRVLDKKAFLEMMALGPAHTLGNTYFKDIFEIKPGHYGIFDFNTFNINEYKYWDLESKECNDTPKEAINKIKDLVIDATKMQISDKKDIAAMLSGGLDSSVLCKIAENYIDDFHTFSIDYIGNDTDFKANSYQQTKDSDFVKIMQKKLKSTHNVLKIDNKELFYLLDNAMIARDMPGMADIDTSMYAFLQKIKDNGYTTCLSGECSDEIFGGYPWYYKSHLMNTDGYPWALSENLRCNLIKENLIKKEDIYDYINMTKKDTLNNVIHLTHDKEENKFKDINYLTIKYFMNTLIERTDRAAVMKNMDIRIPFADYRIFEYVYNLPAKMKLGLMNNNEPIEKYLLRKAFENELPNEIIKRKKSPFPKTYNNDYLNLVEGKIKEIIDNKNSRIHEIINTNYVNHLINTKGKDLKENLFGQLMTYPQTLAYLIQINNWLTMYNIDIKIE